MEPQEDCTRQLLAKNSNAKTTYKHKQSLQPFSQDLAYRTTYVLCLKSTLNDKLFGKLAERNTPKKYVILLLDFGDFNDIRKVFIIKLNCVQQSRILSKSKYMLYRKINVYSNVVWELKFF